MVFQGTHAAGAHGADAIRDTIARVFQAHSYDRSSSSTLGALILRAIERVFDAVFCALRSSPALSRVVLIVGAVILLMVIARVAYVAIERQRLSRRAGALRSSRAGVTDPWGAAQDAAAAGQYTEAAHYLYGALLQALSRRERLRLHPSKTAGDYARDLRAASSASWPTFREFVRAFELVIYGRGECDRAQFERLQSLATPLVSTGTR